MPLNQNKSPAEAGLLSFGRVQLGRIYGGMSPAMNEKYIKEDWLHIKEELQTGIYLPKPVRLAQIPEIDGGIRKPCIPTVINRLIQKSILQIMQPIIRPNILKIKLWFCSGRSAHDAIGKLTLSPASKASFPINYILIFTDTCAPLPTVLAIENSAPMISALWAIFLSPYCFIGIS